MQKRSHQDLLFLLDQMFSLLPFLKEIKPNKVSNSWLTSCFVDYNNNNAAVLFDEHNEDEIFTADPMPDNNMSDP